MNAEQRTVARFASANAYANSFCISRRVHLRQRLDFQLEMVLSQVCIAELKPT
jgi:hypothetical protein